VLVCATQWLINSSNREGLLHLMFQWQSHECCAIKVLKSLLVVNVSCSINMYVYACSFDSVCSTTQYCSVKTVCQSAKFACALRVMLCANLTLYLSLYALFLQAQVREYNVTSPDQLGTLYVDEVSNTKHQYC
jgi:hypothetical protein